MVTVSNKSFNSEIKLSFIIFILIFLIKAPIQAQFQPSGVVKLVEGNGIIIRNGIQINLQKKETIIKNGDLIRTNESGKIILTLLGGDNVFLAPDTEIKFKENKKKKGLSNIINRNLTLKGRLLAKIRKDLSRPIQIRTPNAIVAVKGTEFVTEFIQGITNVGTIKGLVSMTSIVNNKSVELKEGTMSSVNIEGTVMPPSEFSGKLMQDFEFAGDKMSEEDAAGKKIKL
tara:strand:- start:324 stop:1010 length:687 start_codon:yes stop_codon:yes gene_type:complete